MEIQILPREVQEQIAAGEVVERPCHMMKELVENCLDAGSTKIFIEYSSGGREVLIQDNGHGISEANLEKAILRFATSKIQASDDLWKLSTYGFRGEALASIAAVSKLRIKSKVKNQADACLLDVHFGNVVLKEKVQHEVGTTLTISELFENVPARLKFLKSEAAEHGQIRQTLKALALSHPEVEFHVKEKNEMIFYWPRCATRLQRAQQVLEIESLFEGYAERGNVKCWSVMSAPNEVSKTARQIWLFAQGRWIQDRGMQAAVMEAYRGLLMHGEYPFAVLWLEVNSSEIDVNIHPTKSQVKFLDSSLVFRATQASVRDTLEKAPWISAMARKNLEQASSVQVSAASMEQKPLWNSGGDFDRIQYRQKTNLGDSTNSQVFDIEIKNIPIASTLSDQKLFWSNLQVLGQAHLTYILAQSSKSLYLVDQHAAHERIVYEKLMKAWSGGEIEIQEYLFPLGFDLSVEQLEAFLNYAPSLEKFGFRFERLGPQTLGVLSSPSILNSSKWISAIEAFAEDLLHQGQSFRIEEKISDLCATMACHSVVRAGQSLSIEEMRSLLQQMDEFPLSSFCPHGRPVYVEKDFVQLEKDFGRRP